MTKYYKCLKTDDTKCFTVGKIYEVGSDDCVLADDEGDERGFSICRYPEEFELVTETETIGAKKNDIKDKKLKLRFVHKELIEGCCKPMMAGEIKYGDYNYLKGHTTCQLLDAVLRHLLLYREGENLDKDSTALLGMDVTHLDCILSNLNMLYKQKSLGTLIDDRPIVEGELQEDIIK